MGTISMIAWYVHRLTTNSGLTPLHGTTSLSLSREAFGETFEEGLGGARVSPLSNELGHYHQDHRAQSSDATVGGAADGGRL